MDVRSLATLTVLLGIVGGAVWVSSNVDGVAADEAGAVSAALVAELGEFIDESKLTNPPEEMVGDLALCLDTNIDLDVAAVDRDLSGTLIRVIPAERCTSKTVEGDFGMFTAMTTWFDEHGDEAVHLEVTNVRCPSVTRCLVDIDSLGAGMTYEVRRSGEGWATTGERLRWIV
jgi:hypothetical protein